MNEESSSGYLDLQRDNLEIIDIHESINNVKSFNPSIFRRKYKKYIRPFLKISSSTNSQYSSLFLCDTGASISALSQNFFNEISRTHPYDILEEAAIPANFQLKAAGGYDLRINKLYRLKFKLGERCVVHNFYILPELTMSGIIGIDFIIENFVHIYGDGISAKVVYHDQLLKLNKDSDWNQAVLNPLDAINYDELSANVIMSVDKTIPANCSMQIRVKIDLNDSPINDDVIVESVHDSLGLVNAIVRPNKSGFCNVVVYNNTTDNIFLHKNERVGSAEFIEGATVEKLASRDDTLPSKEEVSSCKDPKLLREYRKLFRERKSQLSNFISAIQDSNYKVHEDTSTPKDDDAKWSRIKAQINLDHLPEHVKAKYWELLHLNMDIFSLHKFDLGFCDKVKHNIRLDRKSVV